MWAFPRCLRNAVMHYERRYTIGYINANEILPKELVEQIREYIEGEAIYIPKASEIRRTWGIRTGTRIEYDKRNRAICEEHRNGCSVSELSEKYCLCTDSIRKILRNSKQKT